MELAGAVVVVTGAGGGIGTGLARRFVEAGVQAIELVDRRGEALQQLAVELGPIVRTNQVDVTDEASVAELVAAILARHGRIDLFCSNAGIATGIGLEHGLVADKSWQRAWDVHVMAHVYAARAVVPAMIEAGGGYLLNTASAAGLLSSPGDAPYAVTKHAAVAFAEWLAVEYRSRGIRVSVLCPMGVDTPLLTLPLAAGIPAAKAVAAAGPVLGVEAVVDAVIQALKDETFLVLPHANVGRLWSAKALDVDEWITGASQEYQQVRDDIHGDHDHDQGSK